MKPALALVPSLLLFCSANDVAALTIVQKVVIADLQGGTQNVQEHVQGNTGLLAVGKQESFVAAGGVNQYALYKGSIDVGSQTLTAETQAVGAHGAGVTAFLEYSFSVLGPANVPVPLVMFTPTPSLNVFIGSGTSSGNQAYASLNLFDSFGGPNGINFFEEAQGSLSGTVKSSFVPALHFSLPANIDLAIVDMRLVVASVGSNVAPGQAPFAVSSSGVLDPYVVIDPSFVDADKYHLEFSQGVSNLAPVPAPPAFICLASGLIGLYRRRTS